MKTDTPPASQASALQRVSMVKHATSTACKDASPVGILKHIRDGRWEEKVTHIVDTYKQVLSKTNDPTKAKKAISTLNAAYPVSCGLADFQNAKPRP